jgi:DNA polymerase III alpha subunit
MTLDMWQHRQALVISVRTPNARHRGRRRLRCRQVSGHFETGENRIYYALAAIKGVGDAAVEHIVEVRGDTAFASLEDFCTAHRSAPGQPPGA